MYASSMDVLMDVLVDVACGKGLQRMEGEVLFKTNRPMKLMEALGFRIEPPPEDEPVRTRHAASRSCRAIRQSAAHPAQRPSTKTWRALLNPSCERP
jgi:hypothetical protein